MRNTSISIEAGATAALWISVRGDPSGVRNIRVGPGTKFTAGRFSFEDFVVTNNTVSVQLLGDVAILTHLVRTEITTYQGDATLHERETIVLHRPGGRWIEVHEHLSPRPEFVG